ncbi:MAG: alpha-L-arabinofuranosidase C-terminal domain-containing protein, partial [Christensenellaceae bacterium]
WTKYSVDLTGLDTAAEDVVFEITFTKGTLDIDSISLKPEEHFGSAEIRKDLGEALAALNPSFLRFPGGCVIEGKGLKTAYDWKASIGEGETMTYIDGATGKTVTETGSTDNRALGTDIWANLAAEVTNPYYTSYGIGFYEYFLLCEDLDAAPVPILNCGMSCQIQGGFESIPITNKRFQEYIDDALDLVEFCRGDASTEWGAVRIAMGHAEPFELTYLGIGNEQWGADYFEHFEAFRKAFETAAAENPLYKDIELIVANGPNSGDTYAWNRIKNSGLGADYAGLVDEHYYCTPDWFYANNARYDSYDRDNVPVFLGEYAAKSNTLNAALAEASYATALERNGDIVKLAAYAPLFGNTTSNQWTPDMIFYSNDSYYLTPNYYVQQMIANNKGTVLPGSTLSVAASEEEGITGAVGIGTWATSATFDDILVVKNGSGEVLFSDSSFADASLYTDYCGKWTLEGGVATQSSVSTPSKQTGDVLYFGDNTWSDYTFTVKATKTGGVEGFIIPFCVGDPDNFYHWNIGGWSNTVSCLESATGGVKHGQVAGTVKDIAVETDHEYEIKIVVSGNNAKCYLDGTLYVDYTVASAQGLYQVTSYDEATGDLIIKIVNPGVDNYTLDVSLLGYDVESVADVTVLQSNSLTAANTYSDPDFIKPVTGTLNVSNSFTYEVPFYSFSVIRIHTK